jgi:hypothetical protein
MVIDILDNVGIKRSKPQRLKLTKAELKEIAKLRKAEKRKRDKEFMNHIDNGEDQEQRRLPWERIRN